MISMISMISTANSLTGGGCVGKPEEIVVLQRRDKVALMIMPEERLTIGNPIAEAG
jgi:hypothetical protein